MSQKLSFSSIAATLAVLSASGLVACAGEATPPAASPADAKEVPASMIDAAATVDPGPMKEGVAPSESASGSTPAAATLAPAAEAPKAAEAPAAATAPAKDEKPKAAGKKKAAGAKAGCGAGTCG